MIDQVTVTAKEAAMRSFKDGLGMESNPFNNYSVHHMDFNIELARLQHDELKRELEEMRGGA